MPTKKTETTTLPDTAQHAPDGRYDYIHDPPSLRQTADAAWLAYASACKRVGRRDDEAALGDRTELYERARDAEQAASDAARTHTA